MNSTSFNVLGGWKCVPPIINERSSCTQEFWGILSGPILKNPGKMNSLEVDKGLFNVRGAGFMT